MRQILMTTVNDAIKFKDGKLFMGDHEVIRQADTIEGEDKIPALYVVRVYDRENYPTLVTGLDLIGDKIWIGGFGTGLYRNQREVNMPSAYYDKWEIVEHIFNDLCAETIGKKWAIFEEEDFERYAAEMAEWDQQQFGNED